MRADVLWAQKEKEKTCELGHKAADRHDDTRGLRWEVGGKMRVETQH